MKPRHRAPAWGLAVALVVLVGVPLLAPDHAAAIPAFARKYQMSCTTCHAPFPRLKPYGEEFAARGFRMEPGQEPPGATYDTGDPLLSLPRDLPLAMRMEGYFSYKDGAVVEKDVEWPWVLKLLSGGPIGTTVSYYVYVVFEEGTLDLEDAYIQMNDLFGSGFDLLAGQFQVSDPLFKRELRLERYDYLVFKSRVGYVPADLTYDRGIALGRTLAGDIDFVFQVVNGNGIEPPADDVVSDFVRFDDDEWKSVALRAAREIGSTRIGVFGYWGRTKPSDIENDTYYIGPDLVVGGDLAQLNLEFLYREDDNPFFLGGSPGRDLHCTRGGFAELHVFPQGQDGRWVLSGLYNKVASDDDAADRETISITANHLITRNVRLTLEAGRDLEAEATRASVGLVAAY